VPINGSMIVHASPSAAHVRPAAWLALGGRIALLLISSLLMLGGLALWVSVPTVSYADGVNQASCAATITAVAGGGTREPRDHYAASILRPNLAKTAWQSDDRACTQELRIRFVIGLMAVVAGVALFVLRRRLPGRFRSLRGPPRSPARFPMPRLALVVVVVELILGSVALAVGQSAGPAQALPQRTARIPSRLPAAVVAVRDTLERLGYRQTNVSPYPMQFEGIAPNADTLVVLRLDKPHARGIIQLYFAHLDRTDTPAAAQAASIAWARLDGKQPTVLADNDWILRLGEGQASRQDALGWHDDTRDLFVLLRYEPAPQTLSPAQLLHLMSAR
jgi:hypothetical protein